MIEDQALAQAATQRVDAALVDTDLHGRMVDVVGAVPAERGIPFAWCTGDQKVPDDHGAPVLKKPIDAWELAATLARWAAA